MRKVSLSRSSARAPTRRPRYRWTVGACRSKRVANCSGCVSELSISSPSPGSADGRATRGGGRSGEGCPSAIGTSTLLTGSDDGSAVCDLLTPAHVRSGESGSRAVLQADQHLPSVLFVEERLIGVCSTGVAAE